MTTSYTIQNHDSTIKCKTGAVTPLADRSRFSSAERPSPRPDGSSQCHSPVSQHHQGWAPLVPAARPRTSGARDSLPPAGLCTDVGQRPSRREREATRVTGRVIEVEGMAARRHGGTADWAELGRIKVQVAVIYKKCVPASVCLRACVCAANSQGRAAC